MKTYLLSAFLILGLTACDENEEIYMTHEELAHAFEKSYKKKDLKRIQMLFYQKDARPEEVEALYHRFKRAFDNKVKIEIVSLGTTQPEYLALVTNGIDYDGKKLLPTISSLTHTLEYRAKSRNPVYTQFHMGNTPDGYKFNLMKFANKPGTGDDPSR